MLSELFFTVNFALAIVFSIVGLLGSFIIILIVIRNPQLHTIPNLLGFSACFATICYAMLAIFGAAYGFHETWAVNAPSCSFRAYGSTMTITSICYSTSLQAISHLFFAVLYKHRYLLTWRAHCLMVILSWTISLVLCLPPFFVAGGYALEKESRSCVVTSKMYLLAFYIFFVISAIPFGIMTIIYIIMLIYVHRSTRRVWAITSNVNRNRGVIQRARREMEMMKKLSLRMSMFSIGGVPYFCLTIWHATQKQSPPESLHLLALNLITMAVSMTPIVLVTTSTQLKQLVIDYFHVRQPVIAITRQIHRHQ